VNCTRTPFCAAWLTARSNWRIVEAAAGRLDRVRGDQDPHRVDAELGEPLVALGGAERRLAADEHVLVLDPDLRLGLGQRRGHEQGHE
jgi:hypothetical protein